MFGGGAESGYDMGWRFAGGAACCVGIGSCAGDRAPCAGEVVKGMRRVLSVLEAMFCMLEVMRYVTQNVRACAVCRTLWRPCFM